jgi:Fe-S oxidoreductase
MAPERRVPRFAAQTFKAWYRARGPRNPEGPPVLLWPDTFNNYLTPAVARAAVEVLEAAGYRVLVPEPDLCCGRTVYGYGMLKLGKRLLGRTLDALWPLIRAGVPLVGLEPSCVASFRDELVNLFPDDHDARRLSEQSFLLTEFLAEHAPAYRPPRLARRAVLHGHCHHKAIIGLDSERRLLAAMGLDLKVLDSGCCGLAGSFGYEREHYAVSIAAGERVLLPAVRAAPPEALIIAAGFSCREQVAHATGRRALHPAEVLQMAL